MFNSFSDTLVLSASDVTAIRALYGTRAADPNEGSNGNDTIVRATTVREPGSYDGFTPLVAFGDITTRGDVDVFEVQNQGHYRGPITFRLQTTGVSLLPSAVLGGLSFAQVSAGDRFTCARTPGEAAYCWGDNHSGQLGDGTQVSRLSPRAVVGP